MIIYDSIFEVIEENKDYIELYLKDNNETINIDFSTFQPNEPKEILTYEINDKTLLQFNPSKDITFFMYAKDNIIYGVLENDETLLSQTPDKDIYCQFDIDNFYSSITVKQIGSVRVGILNEQNELLFSIDDFLTLNQDEYVFPYDMGFTTTDFRYTVVSLVHYDRYNLVFTYDLFRKEFVIKKILLRKVKEHEDLRVKVISANGIQFDTEKASKTINFRTLPKGRRQKLFNLNQVKGAEKKNLLAIYSINNVRYYVYSSRNGVFIIKADPYKATGNQSNLRVCLTRKNLYIYGRQTHYAFNAAGKYEYLYLQNEDHLIGKFIRPFKSVKFLKRFGFYKVKLDKLIIEGRIHNNLFVGDKEIPIHNLRRKAKDVRAKTLRFKKFGDQLLVIRTNLRGNLTATVVPFTEEYKLINRIKIKIANVVHKFFKNNDKNVNLYFEKKSERADESGFRVFEEVMKTNPTNSENYFVIDAKAEKYPELKKKYGKHIIEKYSFRHYLNIFRANYFIASELPNHLLNDRLYIDKIRSKLMSVPLIFLQHGIMFAKPVDNPMALGFHKDKNLYNIYKNVISSELEAGEFYKMGYSDEDLILTGLATLDYATLDPDADKIAYMPTYRYWEEALIYNNDIEKTSYYKSIMKIIDAFEEAGLLDRLLIVPHNKFSTFIYENMPEYKDIIESNPSVALRKAKIFITDYSSAIYDAIFRGAYPIFYWEEKDYLIRNYKAIPPVNEDNAPGPIAMSTNDLIQIVNKAIQMDYRLEDEYKEKYRKINKFNDRKNTKRIVQFLIEDNII